MSQWTEVEVTCSTILASFEVTKDSEQIFNSSIIHENNFCKEYYINRKVQLELDSTWSQSRIEF